MIDFLLVALIFFFLGRNFGQGKGRDLKKVQAHFSRGRKYLKRKLNPPFTGVVDYPTPEQIEYEGSEQEKIDKDMIKKMKEVGIVK